MRRPASGSRLDPIISHTTCALDLDPSHQQQITQKKKRKTSSDFGERKKKIDNCISWQLTGQKDPIDLSFDVLLKSIRFYFYSSEIAPNLSARAPAQPLCLLNKNKKKRNRWSKEKVNLALSTVCVFQNKCLSALALTSVAQLWGSPWNNPNFHFNCTEYEQKKSRPWQSWQSAPANVQYTQCDDTQITEQKILGHLRVKRRPLLRRIFSAKTLYKNNTSSINTVSRVVTFDGRSPISFAARQIFGRPWRLFIKGVRYISCCRFDGLVVLSIFFFCFFLVSNRTYCAVVLFSAQLITHPPTFKIKAPQAGHFM